MKNLFGDETHQIVNVASVPHRSPFRYPGGKTWLVPLVRRWLSSLPWKPGMFGEPFAGGAIVGLTALFEDRVDSLAIVELDEAVASVWQAILNGKAKELCERLFRSRAIGQPVKEELIAKQSPEICQSRFSSAIATSSTR
jgi:DNA adenine methylase